MIRCRVRRWGRTRDPRLQYAVVILLGRLSVNILSVVVAAALMMTSGSAEACRTRESPATRLARGHERGLISAVLVTVTHARHIREATGDAHPWEALATVDRALFGSHSASTVRFQRGWGSAACDDGAPIPQPEASWVVYFSKHGNDEPRVWLAYQASVALAADPMLRW